MPTRAVAPMPKKRGAKPKPEDVVRSTTITLRISEGYLGWLDRLADFERCSRSNVVDRALASHAERVGFEAPPKR